jgi:hypothetical protein
MASFSEAPRRPPAERREHRPGLTALVAVAIAVVVLGVVLAIGLLR